MEAEPRRRLSRDRRRELIVEAAAAQFAEHGYAGARLEDIAADAGITKQLLYRHFPDKAALYMALLERHRDDLSGFLDAVPSAGTLEERLRAVIEVWLDYVEAHAYAWKLLFRDSGGGPDIQAFRLEVHGEARKVLVQMLRDLGGRRIPNRELAPLAELLSMGQAALVLWWTENPRLSRAAVVDAITRVWLGVLTGDERRSAAPARSTARPPAP